MSDTSDVTAIVIPDEFRTVEMHDKARNIRYWLVFSKEKSNYEAWIEHLRGPDENTKLLLDLLDRKGTLIDIGANIGTIAVPVAKHGSRVVAIEMNPKNCLKLAIAKTANGLSNMDLLEVAASDYDGRIAYSGEEAWGRVSKTSTPESNNTVDCIQIDSFMSKNGNTLPLPIVIKIDVEGHEAAVLRGSREILRAVRPIVMFESIEIEGTTHKEGNAAKVLLENSNYKLFLIRNNVLSPKASSDLQEGHVCDFLAVPEEAVNTLAQLPVVVRALTAEEALKWVEEMATFPQRPHQRHAAGVFLAWAGQRPDLCARGQNILNKLLKLDHLQDLHERLNTFKP
jgi:FkbM family methyltransferase